MDFCVVKLLFLQTLLYIITTHITCLSEHLNVQEHVSKKTLNMQYNIQNVHSQNIYTYNNKRIYIYLYIKNNILHISIIFSSLKFMYKQILFKNEANQK